MAVLLPFCDSLPFPPRSQLQPSSTGAPSRQSSLLWRSYALSLPPKNFPNCLVFPLQSTLQYKNPPLCVSNPRLFLIEVTTIHAASPKAFPLPPATLACACARHPCHVRTYFPAAVDHITRESPEFFSDGFTSLAAPHGTLAHGMIFFFTYGTLCMYVKSTLPEPRNIRKVLKTT
jgi:hypothetical protein